MKISELSKKEMIQAIKDKYYAIPDMQVSTGVYIHTIGTK